MIETRDRLDQERQRLEAGEEVTPLAPAWRDPASRVNRPGAPLWQLIEFDDPVPDDARAGLEAALEASGLLDAWVSPDGHLQHDPERDGTPWQDTQVLAMADAPVVPRARSLAGRVRVAQVSAGEWPVAAEVVDRVIGSIACCVEDPGNAVAWVSPEGRFRLGTLVGAHTKTTACYLGFAARLAARQRRLTEIENELRQLAVQQQRKRSAKSSGAALAGR